MILLRSYILTVIFLITSLWGKCQLLEPNQPEQDACGAIDLCGKSFTSTYSYQGQGAKFDLSSTPCSSGENNSVWLKVKIATDGIFVFKINPIDKLDDYDFAIVRNDTNCAILNYDQVVRCNFNNNITGSNVNGVIGLSESSNEPFIQGGVTGHSFAQAIDARAGEIYYIMINNFGHQNGLGTYLPSSGFTIDFSTSSATFENTSIPSFGNILNNCDYSKNVTVNLTNYALCGSIAADGSDFIVSSKDQSTNYTVLASGMNCSQATGYTKAIQLTFLQTLPDGDYTINVKKGSDGNTILGLCDGEMLTTNSSLEFTVKHDSLKLVALDSPACKTIKLVFNQTIDCSSIIADGSQFYITGPENVTITEATGTSTCVQNGTSGVSLILANSIRTDGTYQLHFRGDQPLYGTCGNILDYNVDMSFTIHSFNGLLNTISDTTVCRLGDSIPLSTVNNATGNTFQYIWTLNNADIAKNDLSPIVQIQSPKNHFQVQTTDMNGCILRDTVNVAVETYSESLTPTTASICLNDSILLEASSNAIQYQWYQDNNLTQVVGRNFSSDNSATTLFKPDSVGVFTYYLLIKSRKQCLDTLSSTITVRPLPDLQIAFKDTVIDYGTDITLIASGASQYVWTPMKWINSSTSNTPIAHPLTNIIYTVKGIIENGCYTTDSVRIKIFFQDYAFFPSGFTPNKDGKNDIFRPTFFGKINSFKLSVFNRWGQLVFQSNNPTLGWDGTIKGKLAESGTYVWQCQYQPEGENAFDKRGTIVLIR